MFNKKQYSLDVQASIKIIEHTEYDLFNSFVTLTQDKYHSSKDTLHKLQVVPIHMLSFVLRDFIVSCLVVVRNVFH